MDPLMLMLGVLAIFVVMNMLIARPQQKKQAELQRKIAEMPAGTRVMTTSGIYGTALHIGTNQVVLEISPGVEMTVSKAAIREIVDPADDEFEYADEDAATPAVPADAVEFAPRTTFPAGAPADPAATAHDVVDAPVASGSDDLAGYRAETLEESQARLHLTQSPRDDDAAGSSRTH